MKKSIITAAINASLLSIGLFSTTVSAAIITYEQRAINDFTVITNDGYNNLSTTSTPDYLQAWNDQSSPITIQTLTSTSDIKESNSSFEELSISFSSALPESLAFQFALDAGYGGALYLDGTHIAYNANDMWWGYNWNASSQILSGTEDLTAGNHEITAIWAENCCSGDSAAQVSFNNGEYQDLSILANPQTAVPEPDSIVLISAGLLILTVVRRNAHPTAIKA